MPRPGPRSQAEWHEAWAARYDSRESWAGPPPWGAGPPAWRLPPALTLWGPVVLSFLVQVPASIWIARWQQLAPLDAALTVALAAVGPLALIGARRFPGPVVAITALAASADLLLNQGGPPYLALAFAIIGAVVRGARLWAWISVGACWIAAVTIALSIGTEQRTPFRIVGTTLGLLLAFGIGEGLRTRRERVAEFRRRASQRRQTAEQAERVRIARELHDVIAHSLSQINVQAGVGLHLMDTQPEQARAALANIKETSKTSLDEVRSVLGMLRADNGDPLEPMLVPQPDLERLRILATGTGGLTVAIDDRLDHAAIPQAVQSAVFRIVQESITNTVRHAEAATRVDVTLELDDEVVRVEVRDDGVGSRESSADGKGLLGMRERAELLGGTLEAGPAESGGFRILAELPLPAVRRGERVSIRVVLADDQHLIRAGFRALLESEPDLVVVGEAATGRDAVAVVRETVPDVVLMDIRMPDGDGLWATERLAGIAELAGTHIVIVTTFELDEYVVRAIRAGASGFLLKDTEPVELLRAIRVVAAGEALLSPRVTRHLLEHVAGGLAPSVDPTPLAVLTDREREVLGLVGQGLTNDEIGTALFVSPLTAKTHVSRMMSKLHARDRVQLVVIAYETGLVAPGRDESDRA